MATLMSAAASTGTSLTPSPSINTLRPSLCSCCRTCSLSSGRKPPRASSMPSSAATLATIGELSPDSNRVRQPRALQAASRSGASARKRSSRTSHASGPWLSPSSSHCPASSGMEGTVAPLSAQTKPGWPMRRRCSPDPSFEAQPRRAVNFFGGHRRATKSAGNRVFGTVFQGGGETQALIAGKRAEGRIERSARRPSVRVPVLSKITVSIWFRPSST